MAVGTVFVHFPDKNALLSAALEDRIATTLGRSLTAFPEGDVRRRIRHVFAAGLSAEARNDDVPASLEEGTTLRALLLLESPQRLHEEWAGAHRGSRAAPEFELDVTQAGKLSESG